jgi:thiamine-phosphate pyrophosphorylase
MTSRIHGLYVIVDPEACGGRAARDVARLAIEGGASVVQWRDKHREKGDQLDDARAIAALCRAAGVPLIMNDHADLALACGADGVHLGQHDLPITAVRPIVGAGAIIGVSTNNAEEARAAEHAGADYVAVGAIFATGSKGNTRPADLDRIRAVKAVAAVPVVAIGGINAANIDDVVAAGADAAAVISAVCGAADPLARAQELAGAWRPLTS